jgi:dipeptidyl aminopeptidase/acylaminoacyl peptidase
LASPTHAADTSTRRPLAPEDVYRTQTPSEPQVSPDGLWVAYVLTTNDRDGDEPLAAVWMVSWDGSAHVQLTNPAKGTRAPRWSPDGRYLSFLATPPGADAATVMLLDRRGGESRPIAALSGEIGDYAWSPDSQRLVLAVAADGEERVQLAKDAGGGTGKEPAAEKAPKPIVVDALHFKEDEEGYLPVGRAQHLYLYDLAARTLQPLTADSLAHESLPVWSPDGHRIAYVSTTEHGADPDGRCDIRVVEARAGAVPLTLAHPFAPNAQALAFSPDGQEVAYLEGREPRFNAYMQDVLVVVPVAGGASRALTRALDRAVFSYAFAPDSRSITVAVEDDGTVYPASVEVATGRVTRLASDKGVIAELSAAHGHTAAIASSDSAMGEVVALESGGFRCLTGHNDALMAEVKLGAVEELAFRSRDGTEIHGFLVKPPDYVLGRRYPTVLIVHGGPNGQDEHSLGLHEYQFRRQMLAAAGFVVLGVNYRGSTGRGSAFAQAILADWGHLEVEDLLAGVEHAVARGVADPERLGIGGWSYGGILTDYTIASDRRFKAAWSGAGTGNQLAMYGVDQYILQWNHELGPPWRDTALWIRLSYPLLHADRIHTPTLFMGAEKDFNVPVAGAEQMYQALRTLGVPTQLVIYPGQYHDLTRPSFLKDRYERTAAWFSRYLAPTSGSAIGP